MKRHPSLTPLSDDHHRALVLALRLRRILKRADSTEIEMLAREVQEQFEVDLEPHFRVEEKWLIPALKKHGAVELADPIIEDHTHLRDLVRAAWSQDTAEKIGTLLEKHVRFEERVVFPKAEALLSEAELASIREAAENQEDRE